MTYIEPNLEFEWLIHYKCNYRCPYCFFEGMWQELESRNRYRPLAEWLDAWERIRLTYGHSRIIITGGEPFIYPEFTALIEELSKNFYIAFDTNLSCPKELLKDFVQRTTLDNVVMGLSFHPCFAEFAPFLEKALFLKNNRFHICVQYVSYPEQIAQMNIYRSKFEEEGFYFIPLPFRGHYQGKNYPAAFGEEEKQMIYQSIEKLEQEHRARVEKQLNQVKTKGQLCRAGQVYARVDNDGSIYRCGHYVTNNHKPMGSIFDNNFRLSDVPLPCEAEICPCEFRWLVE
jgi:organic radical activating enzyme